MNLTPEEKKAGKENYYEAVTEHDKSDPRGNVTGEDGSVTRRSFLKEVIGASAVTAVGIGGMYYNYGRPDTPVKIGIIGTGDEGGILIGALNPDYVQVVAIADIRPSSIQRAFYGDYGGGDPAKTHSLRPGLLEVYGHKSIEQSKIKIYDNDGKTGDSGGGWKSDGGGWEALINDSNVEAVIIALPLHLHAQVAVAALQAGKHVLTEKLMAHNIAQCKVMSRVAAKQGKYLATGHQRHYSVLYDNAVNMIRWGLLGEIHHIRAQWHRGNLPGNDSWAPPIPGGAPIWDSSEVYNPIAKQLEAFEKAKARGSSEPFLEERIKQWKQWDADKSLNGPAILDLGYESLKLDNYERTAFEELIRWRLWNRTGGGLMAELGSHQLDAASIFISAMNKEKVHPLTVHAVGGRHIFPQDRDADDHVYCTFEFPGPGYDANFDPGYKDPVSGVGSNRPIDSFEANSNKKIVVTYSSINGNGYGGYGEVVMGTKGTLVIEREKDAMLFKTSTTTRVGVKSSGAGPVLDTQESGDGAVAKAAESAPVSRGYAEEIEHWAWCVRNQDAEVGPRCSPPVAVADAVIALTAKYAAARSGSGKGGFIQFKDEWFDINSDEIPETDYYNADAKKDVSIASEAKSLNADI